MKLYGSYQNRVMENMSDPEIMVGMGATEIFYSDRKPYEVVRVDDQKHVTIRRMDAIHTGEAFENSWELKSNEENPEINVVKRGNSWYIKTEVTKEEIQNADFEKQIWLALNGFDTNTINEKGSQTKYHKMNIRFGFADKYYDYEF